MSNISSGFAEKPPTLRVALITKPNRLCSFLPFSVGFLSLSFYFRFCSCRLFTISVFSVCVGDNGFTNLTTSNISHAEASQAVHLQLNDRLRKSILGPSGSSFACIFCRSIRWLAVLSRILLSPCSLCRFVEHVSWIKSGILADKARKELHTLRCDSSEYRQYFNFYRAAYFPRIQDLTMFDVFLWSRWNLLFLSVMEFFSFSTSRLLDWSLLLHRLPEARKQPGQNADYHTDLWFPMPSIPLKGIICIWKASSLLIMACILICRINWLFRPNGWPRALLWDQKAADTILVSCVVAYFSAKWDTTTIFIRVFPKSPERKRNLGGNFSILSLNPVFPPFCWVTEFVITSFRETVSHSKKKIRVTVSRLIARIFCRNSDTTPCWFSDESIFGINCWTQLHRFRIIRFTVQTCSLFLFFPDILLFTKVATGRCLMPGL